MSEPNSRKFKIGIIGAAGLSAGRLIEILLRHPAAEILCCVSESSPGTPVAKLHPQLRGLIPLLLEDLNLDKLSQCDVVFSCKKAGESFNYVGELIAAGVRVIDLSGDFRLQSTADYFDWYNITHEHPGLLQSAVYGLPELHREKIRQARLLANPGCYTTTTIIGCAPFVEQGFGLESPLIVDAISGVSGAGRAASPEKQYISVAENVRAYRIGKHQHTPEIEQELGALTSKGPIRLLFVPHVGPFKVGIMANSYLRIAKDVELTDDALYSLLKAKYASEPFVRIYEPGTLPQIEFVVGSNFCDVGAIYDKRTSTIVVVSVTDNLVKGAAGQAVQNMNIMFGLEETAGLL